MTLRYEIDESNAVRIFYPESEIASIYQPTWPDQEPWADAQEAAAWAELYIASINDEEAPYAPNARGEAGASKPTAEQKIAIEEAHKLIQAAQTQEEYDAARASLDAIFNTI